jgi:hypothetical protein
MDNKPGMNEDRWCGPLSEKSSCRTVIFGVLYDTTSKEDPRDSPGYYFKLFVPEGAQ